MQFLENVIFRGGPADGKRVTAGLLAPRLVQDGAYYKQTDEQVKDPDVARGNDLTVYAYESMVDDGGQGQARV